MSLQSKSRRRLLYIVVGVVAISALGGSAALIRMQYIRQRALQGRVDGLADMAQEDYTSALTHLGTYLSRYPNDADILLSYARARQSVEEPNGAHLGQAIALYRRVLELQPGLADAQQRLLDVYIQVGFNTEAGGMADAILAREPDNTHALRAKAVASLRTRKFSDAKDSVVHLTRVAPLDMEFRVLELQVALSSDGPNNISNYANRLALAYPNDVRFELLKSVAASFAGDSKSAIALAEPLVAHPLADPTYMRLLIRQLDALELFAQAFTVTEQAAQSAPDRELTRMWIRRLFETNRLPLLIDQTAALDATSRATDPEILGMRVLALTALNRSSEAVPILAALDKRGKSESSAARWAVALRASAQRETSDPVQTISQLRDAITASPGNPILVLELGDAYAAAGAGDKASAAWRQAAQMAPAWATPLVRISQSLIAAGRAADALEAAHAAQLRAPQDHDALLCVAVASATNLPNGASADAAKVLELIADIQHRFPNDFDLLPLQAGVLAQSQHPDVAIRVIQSALDSKSVPPERILLSLAQVSETFRLGREEACWALDQKAYGLTADLAFARAAWLRSQQHGPEALALLEQARAAHGANDPLWQSMWAQYLDQIGDERAKAQWIAVGDQNPRDVKLQWAALSARSVQADHDFVGRTLDRLVALLGQDSLTLRLMRARWLLQGQANDNDTTQASILLSDISRNSPDMLAPRVLLAACYLRMGNTSGAIDELAAVSDMQPELPRIPLELARLLQDRGDFTRARQYIDRACHSQLVTLQDIRQAASLLAMQGQYATALALLEKAYGEKQPPDLMLAALYQQLNQPAKTAEICRRLLEKPDAPAIQFAAEFYASQDQPDQAHHALAMLDGLVLPPGRKELILADYAARHDSPASALKEFQAATQLAPNEAALWQSLVMYCLSIGKIDEALTAADAATHHLDTAAGFETFRQYAALVKDAGSISSARPLLMTLAMSSAANAPVTDALRLIVAAAKHSDPPRQTAGKLRQLADRNPRVLALQTVTLQFYMEAGQIDDAITLATRAVQTFPAAVEPLRAATSILRVARRWDEELGAAKEWRRRDSTQALDADLAIAGAQLQLGDVSAATQQIQPYLERAMQDPDKFSGVILLRAQGLLAARQPDQAEALMGPLLAKSEAWRSLWLSLAVHAVDDPKRAQAWLQRVAPLTSDSLTEHALLAQAWIDLGNRWANVEFEQTGKAMLTALAASPDAPLEALLQRAVQEPDKFSALILLRAQKLIAAHQADQVEALLGPLLAKSEWARRLWLSLAVRDIDDPKRAQAWLERVTPMAPDNGPERSHLAQAWLALGARWSNVQFQQKGRKMLQTLAQAPDAPVEAMLAWGGACEASADWAGAQQIYRRALQRDPAAAVAMNNLAYVLVRSGGSLDEAGNLIAKALDLKPHEPAFLDTKAAVQAALKNYSGAVATIREAQKLDPQRVEWHVSLMAIFEDAGQLPAARDEMQTIASLLPASSSTSIEVRQRYESLRAKLQ